MSSALPEIEVERTASRREAGERTVIQDETVYSKKSDSGTETTVQIPVKIRKMFYRYTAEFYRTDSSSE